jgi:CRP/FNR family cyclic AMP-dependent transcriptional regulator
MRVTVVLAVGLNTSLLTAQSFAWKSAGYIVTSTGSVKEAIEHFRNGDFDLVLVGHTIPIEHRERLALLIRASGSRTPIVCIAGSMGGSDPFADATLKSDSSALLTGMETAVTRARNQAAYASSYRNANPMLQQIGTPTRPPDCRNGASTAGGLIKRDGNGDTSVEEYLDETEAFDAGRDGFQHKAANGSTSDVDEIPVSQSSGTWRDGRSAHWKEGKFCNCLSPEAITEMESLAVPFYCGKNTVLFAEEEKPGRVLFLLKGRVRLVMNSIEGRRLAFGIAEPGDILGLASVISGCPYEVAAEAQLQCRIASVPRQVFLDFLLRYPAASHNVSRQLSLEHKQMCEHLRMIGLRLTPHERLARLLLEWSAKGQRTERGVQIHCTLTHGEIGECIGVARETVSRTMTHFKNRELVERHGSTLVISSLLALEICAGQITAERG